MKTKAKPGCLPLRRLLLVFCGYLLLTAILIPSTILIRDKWTISSALRHARSVELIHYKNRWDSREPGHPEKIISSKTLSPAEFHLVGDAFPLCPNIGPLMPFFLVDLCVFNPHHRIIITDATGHKTVIEVCFECDHYAIGDGDPDKHPPIVVTPWIWQTSLRRFFADQGMANQPGLYYP